MNESPAIVFVVLGHGFDKTAILGVYVDEVTANVLAAQNADLYNKVEIEPWQLSYQDVKASMEYMTMKTAQVKPESSYQKDDFVHFRDATVSGKGVITNIDTACGDFVYTIECGPRESFDEQAKKFFEESCRFNMYHSEITGRLIK